MSTSAPVSINPSKFFFFNYELWVGLLLVIDWTKYTSEEPKPPCPPLLLTNLGGMGYKRTKASWAILLSAGLVNTFLGPGQDDQDKWKATQASWSLLWALHQLQYKGFLICAYFLGPGPMIPLPAPKTDSRGVILLPVYTSVFWTVFPKMAYAPIL